MNDISQTKEGFIKSMILFIVLLGICFAPFFAFAGQTNSGITVNTQVRNTYVDCEFSTLFNCTSYAIEARSNNTSEFAPIMSCNDAMCMDASQTVRYSFDLSDFPYTEYRIKAIDELGISHYIYGVFNSNKQASVELVSNAVNDMLFVQFNNGAAAANFTYCLSGFNGEALNGEMAMQNNQIDLTGLSQGFYIISFRSSNGEEYHYKFLKQ